MTLDLFLESRIEDYWNVDDGPELSGPWTSFTQFTTLNKEHRVFTRGLGGGKPKFKQHSGRSIYCQTFGLVCRKALNKKKEGLGLLKSQSSKMLEY